MIKSMYRFALIGAAILVTLVFALRYQDGSASSGQTILALLVLSALPLITFWAAPGKTAVRVLLFALTCLAAIAAVEALLGVGEAWPLIRRWLWILIFVGGGLMYWRLEDDQ